MGLKTTEGDLAYWRALKKAGKLETRLIKNLDRTMPGWDWTENEQAWAKFIAHLDEFVAEFGHANVPQKFTSGDGYNLGSLVSKRRRQRATLRDDQVAELERRPGWVWGESRGTPAEAWVKFLTHLDAYVTETGNANVPTKFVSADGYQLGSLVGNRRRRRATLRPDQVTELERRPGWVWCESADTPEEAWAKLLTHLDEYVAEFGHANVPFRFVSADGYQLGILLGKKRERRARLRPDQMTELESRRGWVWDASANTRVDAWAKFLTHLDEFIAETGHANVPRRFVSVDGYKLGLLMHSRRSRRATLSPDQVTELERRPGWRWPASKSA